MFSQQNILLSQYHDEIGLFLVKSDVETEKVLNYQNVFKCTETQQFVSNHFLYDGEYDCGIKDSSDQKNQNCSGISCKDSVDMQMTCLPLFYRNRKAQCISFIGFITQIPAGKKAYFYCKNGMIISSDLVNDLVSDCGQNSDDEPALNLLVTKFTSVSCPEPTQLHCKAGHPKCYNMSEICTYRLDDYKLLTPCRTGSHMENCEQFQCPKMFKCVGYYCIPHSYVCDGKWDCPGGTDETKKFVWFDKKLQKYVQMQKKNRE